MKRFQKILIVVADVVPPEPVFAWLDRLVATASTQAVDFLVFDSAGDEAEDIEEGGGLMVGLGHACAGRFGSGKVDLLDGGGEPLRGTLERLAPGDYDLVVLPVSGRRSRNFAERLARKSPVGVLMLPENAVVPPVRIVAALDFSELTAAVIDWAEAFATLHPEGARLEAVHVVDPNVPVRATLIREESKLQKGIREVSRWQLDEVLHDHAREDSKWSRCLLAGELPGVALAEHARSAADLLVAGNHGRNALTLALMGSNTADLLQEAECPVLVVKQKNRSLAFLRQLLGMEA